MHLFIRVYVSFVFCLSNALPEVVCFLYTDVMIELFCSWRLFICFCVHALIYFFLFLPIVACTLFQGIILLVLFMLINLYIYLLSMLCRTYHYYRFVFFYTLGIKYFHVKRMFLLIVDCWLYTFKSAHLLCDYLSEPIIL